MISVAGFRAAEGGAGGHRPRGNLGWELRGGGAPIPGTALQPPLLRAEDAVT